MLRLLAEKEATALAAQARAEAEAKRAVEARAAEDARVALERAEEEAELRDAVCQGSRSDKHGRYDVGSIGLF